MSWLDDLANLISGGGSGGGYPMPAIAGPGGGAVPMSGGGTGTWPGDPNAGGGGVGSNPMALIAQLLGLGGGAYYGMNQLQALQRIYQQQQQAANLAMNPGALAQRTLGAANMLTPAINRTLAYTLNQGADLNSAERGMGQSPGAVASARAQALAPAAEQNTLEGLNLGSNFATYGLPMQFARNAPNYLSTLQQLQSLGAGGATGGFPGVS